MLEQDIFAAQCLLAMSNARVDRGGTTAVQIKQATNSVPSLPTPPIADGDRHMDEERKPHLSVLPREIRGVVESGGVTITPITCPLDLTTSSNNNVMKRTFPTLIPPPVRPCKEVTVKTEPAVVPTSITLSTPPPLHLTPPVGGTSNLFMIARILTDLNCVRQDNPPAAGTYRNCILCPTCSSKATVCRLPCARTPSSELSNEPEQ